MTDPLISVCVVTTFTLQEKASQIFILLSVVLWENPSNATVAKYWQTHRTLLLEILSSWYLWMLVSMKKKKKDNCGFISQN